MAKTTDQLVQIVSSGGGVIIDGSHKTTDQLQQIVTSAVRSGATIIIRNVDGKTTDQLRQIASRAPGRVIFEL